MRVGLIGPPEWSQRVDEFNVVLDVQWGTDEPARVATLLRERNPVEAVVVEGSIDFLTSAVVATLTEQRVKIFALVGSAPESHWTDSLAGVTRVTSLADVGTALPALVRAGTEGGSDSTTREVAGDEGSAIRERVHGSVVAVWGPVGAPGVTSVSIGLAVLAAREGKTVVLCDADSRGASVAIGLGLIDDVPGFAAACRLANRDEFTLSEFTRLALVPERYGGRISVLTGLPRASRWSEISAPRSRRVVSALREWADVVIIDVGFGIEENEWVDGAPQRDGGARAVLSDADVVVAVGRSDAVGVSRLIRGLDELTELCESPVVVVNHTSRQSAREAQDVVERFSNSRVDVTIHADSRGGIEDAATRAHSSMREVWVAVQQRIFAAGEARER